jgi:L-lactate dehydrogenase complex protein LldG
MTDARDAILARLRSAAVEAIPEPELPVRRFDWDLAERRQRFEQAVRAVRGDVHAVGDDWPVRLAALLRERGADNLYYGAGTLLAPELVAGWPDAGPMLIAADQPIETNRDALFDQAAAGLTSCRAGIAETGSLVLWPTPAEPRLLSLVPPIHCALLDVDRICSTLHELIVTEGWVDDMPTNALLITGPSKSADIEQTLTYGVHGPRELIVLLRG